ncbi:hypothetical protein FHG87_005002 [Trinorchestia longiramus]|nr:hypothetical protein FHG87_005002 [Trinorchestia longiramus]
MRDISHEMKPVSIMRQDHISFTVDYFINLERNVGCGVELHGPNSEAPIKVKQEEERRYVRCAGVQAGGLSVTTLARSLFGAFLEGSSSTNQPYVRCKTLSVNKRIWRGNEGNTRLCLQHNRGVEETVEHLVLKCSKYEHERESLMDVVHEQCGENEWNARYVAEDSGMRYLVGLDVECNMTVVDAMKDFLVHAWNK